MSNEKTELYDSKIYGYEIAFAIISLIKIPVLAYVFTVANGWLSVAYAMTFLWVIAIIFEYCFGIVIAKLCNSVFSAIMSFLASYMIFIIVDTLLLLLKTGGNDFLTCMDVCNYTPFLQGVLTMIAIMGAPMIIVLASVIINAIKKKKYLNDCSQEKKMNIQKTKAKTPDGFELDVKILTPKQEVKKTVVMSHGLTSSMDGRRGQLLKIAEALCNSGYKVIQYDFRGHGKSSGIDLDVSPNSLFIDLKTIIEKFTVDGDCYLFGFSFGGFATCEYLYYTKNTSVKKVVLIGPPLDPINSSLLNPKEFCQPEIQAAIDSGSLEKDGYAYWSSKDFKVSKKFLEECHNFNYRDAIACLSGRTLLLQGTNDKNVDRDFNKKYAEEYNLEYKEYDASHSLWEVIDEVAETIVAYYNA